MKRKGKHSQLEFEAKLSLCASSLERVQRAAPMRLERFAGLLERFSATAHNTFSHEQLAVSLRPPAGDWLADRARMPPQCIPAALGAGVSDRARPGPWGNG